MANITVNTSGTPIIITAGGASALPYTLFGVQNTGNVALPFLPKRIVWSSPSSVAGDMVIIQDKPGVGGTGTARDIVRFVANGQDFMPPQEWKRSDTEAGFVGAVITQFDSGELQIYL